jgi:endoglucanase
MTPPLLRGINLVGMEGGYGGGVAGSDWDRAVGPIAGHDYPAFAPELLNYYRDTGIGVLRLLISWERLQAELGGPLPAAGAGYAAYFADLQRVVGHATGSGITVIVEPWQANAQGGAGGVAWRGQVVGSPGVEAAAFADFWSKLAAVFADNPLVHYGLINEPHDMSTTFWWTTAQACVTSIRSAGATTTIHVPGNGYTAAASWTSDWYDTALPRRSNAHGWLNANGEGIPLSDPLARSVAEVHVYLDADGSGSTTEIATSTVARDRVAVALTEATAHGYRVFVGEIGCYAGNPLAPAAWRDFVSYVDASAASCAGYAWWAGGNPGWWDDAGANGGGHFSVTPQLAGGAFAATVNMAMIAADFT